MEPFLAASLALGSFKPDPPPPDLLDLRRSFEVFTDLLLLFSEYWAKLLFEVEDVVVDVALPCLLVDTDLKKNVGKLEENHS